MDNYLPIVEVSINGSGPYRFLIDTGTPYGLIKESLVQQLSLAASDKVFVKDSYWRHSDRRAVVSVEEMRIGQAILHYQLVVPARDEEISNVGAPDIDGILGINIFNDCLAEIDFSQRQLRLMLGHMERPPDGKEVFAFNRPYRPVVNVCFRDDHGSVHTWPFLIDTGNNSYFLLPTSVREIPFRLLRYTTAMSQTLYKRQSTMLFEIDAIAYIGKHDVTPVFVESSTDTFYAEGRELGLLGTRVLEKFIITLDVRAKRFSLQLPETDNHHRACNSLHAQWIRELELRELQVARPTRLARAMSGTRY